MLIIAFLKSIEEIFDHFWGLWICLKGIVILGFGIETLLSGISYLLF